MNDPARDVLVRRHLRWGWWSLGLFVVMGAVLESLHGFKADWYVDASAEPRRLVWRLAHAHGTFLALVHMAFALCQPLLARSPRIASPCLMGASIAIPGGFFLGGITFHGGDPGVGIFVLPLGVAMLVVAVVVTARAAGRRSDGS